MLDTNRTMAVIRKIRQLSQAKIYMYTALLDVTELFYTTCLLDDITVHNQSDMINFKLFNAFLTRKDDCVLKKSYRLNVFKGIDLKGISLDIWKVKDNVEWIRNCPLPKNEIFKRLKDAICQ